MCQTMITVTVCYGNHNSYKIDLPPTIQLGKLQGVFPGLINQSINNILYIIIAGGIVGSRTHPFTMKLGECDIINNNCVAHMVFKSPDIVYPDRELYISHRNMSWINNNTVDTVGFQESPITPGVQTLLEALGNIGMSMDFNVLDDVTVVLTTDEYNQCITHLDTVPDSECTICQSGIDIDSGVSLECSHAFHDHCIRDWLTTTSVKCPTCNYDVRQQDL